MNQPPSPGSTGPQRVQKVLAHAGLASRRAVEEMIESGRIKINGRRATLGDKVDPDKDEVQVDGSPFSLRTDVVHYLLNKPAGVVVTSSDPEGRPTVIDLLDVPKRIWPVGRLDIESEGALILTNDGELTQLLTHPSHGVPKTYLVDVEGTVGGKALRLLRTGVELEDGRTAPAEVALMERVPGGSLVEITISEGRNRQVRRMMEAVGHPVRRLVRTAIGPLEVGRLKPGAFRKLSPIEIAGLHRAAGD